jgi:hypothetical protein
MGFNENTRVYESNIMEPQFVKIKQQHSCTPPALYGSQIGVGTVWKCQCGHKWKVHRHIVCDDGDHANRKWRRKILIFNWIGSRY